MYEFNVENNQCFDAFANKNAFYLFLDTFNRISPLIMTDYDKKKINLCLKRLYVIIALSYVK